MSQDKGVSVQDIVIECSSDGIGRGKEKTKQN